MIDVSGPALLARIIAHRGASGNAPENTLAALSLAADEGASCVEIDVSISADHIPFVHHDDTLERCTTGTGLLCDSNAADLDQLDASKGMANFIGEPLPRLSAVFDLLEARGMGLNLEIKPRKGLEKETVEAICSLVGKSWPSHLPLVFSSFSRLSLELARDRLPQTPRGLLVGGIPSNWQSLMSELECRNIHCDGNALTPEQAAELLAANVGIFCYTINDVDRARMLLEMGVHGVITDFPKRLASYLDT
ncbi:glycerophosphodiester phosphodiesterase family protein [Granulosicoccus antarcticus]|uniref:Glycerophosphoryl diester phosphodiesterase n=1 Tax=Granulosicoccus antarcticus IMCC3135 TaxID=1192854 RepID=A0A2Z2NVZ4_9GAMM|nr:glycerophosphodiester phosphodiesterase family protein [Granulosicoccus antarcticus]ASJ75636.1 Glycerophosphoryl diester phosphodiesterase [Granulosicoccus antarcticus IMCC3135]